MKNLSRLRLMLLLLIALLAACAQSSTEYVDLSPPIPALPVEARQGEARPICSPTCSKRWSEKAEQWQQKLTGVE